MANNYLYDEQIIVGKTVKSIVNNNNKELLLDFTDGSRGVFYHGQDCCESVYIQESDDLSLLEAATITAITKEETDASEYSYDSSTLTTLLFVSKIGKVKVTWLGISNGYYSESVDFKFYPADSNED